MTAFSLGTEAREGRFERQASRFRRWVTADGSPEFPAEPGRNPKRIIPRGPELDLLSPHGRG